MKHCKRLLILTLLLLLPLTAASAETVLASWTEDTPARLLCAGGRWYAMLGSYGRNDATLAVGDAPDALTTVHTDEAKVWSFEAAPTHAAWVQIAEDTFRWMLYDHASGQVTEVWREADVDKRPCVTLALDEEALYYVRSDMAAESSILYRRSLADGAETVLRMPGGMIASLTMRQGELILAERSAEGWQLLRLNAETGDELAVKKLPAIVETVFTADYDPAFRSWAAYYRDTSGREQAGILSGNSVLNVYTFGWVEYAYDEALEMVDGHLIWTIKREVSGVIADNFITVDYDLRRNQVTEHRGSCHFQTTDGGLLLLRIDPENSAIVLEQAR